MTTIMLEQEATTAALALLPTAAATGDNHESDVPNIDTPAHLRSQARWRKVRDLYYGGVEAIRAGGTFYLPAFRGEAASLYAARRTIAGLFNGFKRTVLATVGLICEPEPVLAKDMPESLVTMWENVDGAGQHGSVFFTKLTTASVVDGMAGIITEYPRANDPRLDRSRASLAATVSLETGAELDAADVAALGLRPYFVLCKADEVLPIYETVNGKRTLVMLIRREVATERKGRFGLVSVMRYRVYELKGTAVYYERWSATGERGKVTRDEGPTLMRNLTGIPWSPMVSGVELSANEYMPPLMDLAELNLTHHRLKTGLLSLQEQAYVPTPVRIGCPADENGEYPELVTGPSNTIEIPGSVTIPQPVYYLSPPVDVLEPGMKSIEDCKTEMGAMGATFLAPQLVQETAAAKRMDGSAERASISSISRAGQDCLESAFGFAAQYLRERAGSVTVNKDFLGEGVDTTMLTALMTNYQSDRPIVTLEEIRTYLQTGELPETFTADDQEIVLELSGLAAAREDERAEQEAAAAAAAAEAARLAGGV